MFEVRLWKVILAGDNDSSKQIKHSAWGLGSILDHLVSSFLRIRVLPNPVTQMKVNTNPLPEMQLSWWRGASQAIDTKDLTFQYHKKVSPPAPAQKTHHRLPNRPNLQPRFAQPSQLLSQSDQCLKARTRTRPARPKCLTSTKSNETITTYNHNYIACMYWYTYCTNCT